MSGKPRRPVRMIKPALFRGALALLVVGAFEVMSWAGLSILYREWYSADTLKPRLDAALAEAEGALDAPALPDQVLRALDRPQVIHPYLGFALDPTRHWAADAVRHGREEAADYGFPHNTESLLQTQSEDRCVIAVFGGSVAQNFAEGAGGVELKRLLRDASRLQGREPVLLCAAVSGYKQPQQLMALNYLMMVGAHFDIVVNLDGVNEVAHPAMDLIPKGVFPFFPYGWYWRVAPLDTEDRLAIGRIAVARQQRALWASRFSGSLVRHSRTVALLWTVRDRSLDQSLSRHRAALLEEKEPSESYQARGPRRTYRSNDAMFRDIAAVWQRCSFQMHSVCAGHGIEYYHCLQPNQYVPESKPYSDAERTHALVKEGPWGLGVGGGTHSSEEWAELFDGRVFAFTI